MTIKLDHCKTGFLWDCLPISNQHIAIEQKKYYKHHSFIPLLCLVIIPMIVFLVFSNLIAFIVFAFFFIVSLASFYFINLRDLALFRRFEIEVISNQLFINKNLVNGAFIFCVQDPDNYYFNPKNKKLLAHSGQNKSLTITGFQFITEKDTFYATQLFSLSRNHELWDIFDFLINNKIKFKYKYKIIDKIDIDISNMFRQFEAEFGLEKFEMEETAVESDLRYISKHGKLSYEIGEPEI